MTEFALYTFSSDCEAEYARDHANTDATFDENAEEGGQAEKSTTNELYSTLLKIHDGSCAEIDTATDHLMHEYELTQEAGQAARESVAAREEDEMSFRDGFALMSLKRGSASLLSFTSTSQSHAQSTRTQPSLRSLRVSQTASTLSSRRLPLPMLPTSNASPSRGVMRRKRVATTMMPQKPPSRILSTLPRKRRAHRRPNSSARNSRRRQQRVHSMLQLI